VFFGIALTLRKMVEKCIGELTVFIDKNSVGKHPAIPHRLNHVKPFHILGKKITQLVAQIKEQNSNYMHLNKQFFDLVNITQEGWVMADNADYIYFCNKKLIDMLEYDDETDIIGSQFSEFLYSPEDAEKIHKTSELSHVRTQTIKKINFVTRKGTKKECRLTCSYIFGDEENVIGYYYVITDVTGLYSLNIEQAELIEIRSTGFEKNSQPMVVIDSEQTIIDINTAFINYVHKERAEIIAKPFYYIIKDMEAGKSWQSDSQGFEVFEPSLKKWFYISPRELFIEDKKYLMISFLDLESYRKEYNYSRHILEDFRGFYFITNKQNVVVYVSPSFAKITQINEGIAWFVNYYKMFQLQLNKTISSDEMKILNNRKTLFEFRVIQLFTSSDSINLYQATLK
jgi:PAS domain S-box-containing protein